MPKIAYKKHKKIIKSMLKNKKRLVYNFDSIYTINDKENNLKERKYTSLCTNSWSVVLLDIYYGKSYGKSRLKQTNFTRQN